MLDAILKCRASKQKCENRERWSRVSSNKNSSDKQTSSEIIDNFQLKNEQSEFNIKTRADISLPQNGKLSPYYPIDASEILKTQGITPGNLQAQKLESDVQRDMINAQKRCVNATSQSLGLGKEHLPYESTKQQTHYFRPMRTA